MSSGLNSAWIKLGRATHHAEDLRREIVSFLTRHPKATFTARFDGEVREGAEGVCGIYVDRGYPDPADPLPMILGDAIHGYRCALDHVAWRLVEAGGAVLTAKQQRRVMFPIIDDEGSFSSALGNALPQADPSAVDSIRSRLAFVNGQTTGTPLHALRDLSNHDKHRSIHLVVAALGQLEISFDCTGCTSHARGGTHARPVLRSGEIVAALKVRYTSPDPSVEFTVTPSPCVVLEDGREITNLLGDIHDEVRAILKDPAIVSAAAA